MVGVYAGAAGFLFVVCGGFYGYVRALCLVVVCFCKQNSK